MAGLISLISCKQKVPDITLIRSSIVADFPSGSAISFYEDYLYLVGDDATQMLILDSQYNKVDSCQLFEWTSARIDKKEKADIESTTILNHNDSAYLLLMGSGSAPKRELAYLIPIQRKDTALPTAIDLQNFFAHIKHAGIKEINIEGCASADGLLVLSNRANQSSPLNQLVVTENFLNATKFNTHIITLELPGTKDVIGISGLEYNAEEDILFFVASTELTANAYDDGAIGDSYIGWINNFSKQRKQTQIVVDACINLPEIDKRFLHEKIESICVEAWQDNAAIVHLVSDNDNGVSRLFKLTIRPKD